MANRPTHAALAMQDFLKSSTWSIIKADLAQLEKTGMIMLEEGKSFDEVQQGRGILRAVRSIPKRFESISKETEKE